MIASGADVNALDSYGSSGIWRFCLQAAQILPAYNYSTHCESDNRIFTRELEEDLTRIVSLLSLYHADFSYVSPNTKLSVMDFYKEGAVARLLKKTVNGGE